MVLGKCWRLIGNGIGGEFKAFVSGIVREREGDNLLWGEMLDESFDDADDFCVGDDEDRIISGGLEFSKELMDSLDELKVVFSIIPRGGKEVFCFVEALEYLFDWLSVESSVPFVESFVDD